MKSKKSLIIVLILLISGIVLILYPSFSNWWNSQHSSKAIVSYSDAIESVGNEEAEKMLKDAEDFNKRLSQNGGLANLTDDQWKEYEKLLDPMGNGMMGYLESEKIHLSLPIYHGTAEETLQVAAGHLEWSSLPVGGKTTHCVLSGHTGLPSARLFTDIERLEKGDIFTLTVLDRVLTYKVDSIKKVLPEKVASLKIKEGKDYCTLVTCTPYGINTHRLLIRGHRIPNLIDSRIKNEVIRLDMVLVEGLIISLILILIIVLVLDQYRRNKAG